MDISAVTSILSTYYETMTTQGVATDSSTLASKLATRLLDKRDSDSDGYLTNSDISELSSDEFSNLDADRDGKLSSDEVTSAFASQMDSIKLLAQSGGASGHAALAALRNTAAGKLMRAINSVASNSSSTSSATATSPPSSSSSSSSLLDVTA